MVKGLGLSVGFVMLIAASLSPALAEKRVALVIGNSAYQHAIPLKNPKNDANAIADALSQLDFEVLKGIDLTHRQFGRTVAKFRRALVGSDVALFFYAGHGMQVHGRNFLVPVDAQLESDDSLDFEAVRLRTVLKLMETAPRTNLVFLDACRDNPLARNLARNLGTRSNVVGRGFAREETGLGTMIAFATQPGNVALDGTTDHSPFTNALLKHIATPGQDIANLMRRVRVDVVNATSSQQVPWNHSSLMAPFVFNTKPKQVDRTERQELSFWESVQAQGSKSGFQDYLKRYPKGEFATLARIRLAELSYQETLEADRLRREKEQLELARIRQELVARQALLAKAETERKRRDEAERKSLAKELARLEAERRSLAEQPSSPDPAKVANFAPDKASPPEKEVEPILDPRTLALSVQQELRRVGCYTGAIDGIWGRGSRGALANFARHGKVRLAGDEPSQANIDLLKAHKARVCPLQCGRNSVVKDGRCVVRSKPKSKKAKKSAQKRASPKKTTAPQKQTSQPKKPSGTFNLWGPASGAQCDVSSPGFC